MDVIRQSSWPRTRETEGKKKFNDTTSKMFPVTHPPRVVSRNESETRGSRNNKISRRNIRKGPGSPPPSSKYIRVYFTLVAPCVSQAEGRARRKNSKNFRLPEPRGILRAAWTTLCYDPFIFLSSSSFFLRPRAPDTRGITGRKLGHLVENSRGG